MRTGLGTSQVVSQKWSQPDHRAGNISTATLAGYHFWRDLLDLWETAKKNVHVTLTPVGRAAL